MSYFSIGRTHYSALSLNAENFRILCHTLVRRVVPAAKMMGAEAIAVRGTSGLSVAFGMRMLTDFPIIVCRKEGETSHSSNPISVLWEDPDPYSYAMIRKYVILDDMVSSGSTVCGIAEDLEDAKCVGVFTYQDLLPASTTGSVRASFTLHYSHGISLDWGEGLDSERVPLYGFLSSMGRGLRSEHIVQAESDWKPPARY